MDFDEAILMDSFSALKVRSDCFKDSRLGGEGEGG